MAPDGESPAGLASPPDGRPRVVVGLPAGPAADAGQLRQAGLEVLAVAASGPAVARAVEEHRPDLVLVHTHLPDANADLPRHLRDAHGVHTLLLAPASLHQPAVGLGEAGGSISPLLRQAYPAALLAEAERVGCAFVAAWPPHQEELRLLVAQVLSRARPPAESLPAGSLPGPAGAAERAGRVTVVWGLKGGTGKSVVAVNLACGLAHRGDRRVW